MNFLVFFDTPVGHYFHTHPLVLPFFLILFCFIFGFVIPFEIHREHKELDKEKAKQCSLEDELLRKEIELKQAQIDYYKTHSSQENDTF